MLKRFSSKVISNEKITEDVFLISFEKPSDFIFQAGQFLNIEVSIDGLKRMKSYSICSPPSKSTLDFCIKIVEGGKGSNILANASVGDEFNMIGPFGHLMFDKDAKKHVFVCAGTGIAPFYSIIHEFENVSDELVLVAGYKYNKNVLFDNEFLRLQSKHKNFTYIKAISREFSDNQGRVQKFIPILKDATYYICGLKELVLETKDLLESKGITNIRVERYS